MQDTAINESQWFRGKASDTFAPVGPVLVSGLNYKDLLVQSRLNGQVMQSKEPKITFMILMPSSVTSVKLSLLNLEILFILVHRTTSSMVPGDVIEIEVEGVGILKNGNE